MRPRPGVLVTLVAAVLSVSAGRAAADDARDRAMERFREGRKLYQVSEYRAALEEFKGAYLVKEDPVFLFNIAQCHRQLGEREQAITFYKRYLATAPAAENRAQVERTLRELEVGRADRPGAPPEPEPPPPAPPPLGDPPAPTPRKLSFAAPPAAPEVPLAAAARPPERSEADAAPVYQRWWFWTIVAAAAAAGVGAYVFVKRQPSDPACPPGVKC